MAESYHNGGGPSTRTYTFSQKWGDDPFTAMGHAQVPAALFVYGARLGVEPEEGYLICCILHFKRTPSDEGPNQEKLAELFGKSPETVRRLLRRIEGKGLLVVTRERGDLGYFTHTVYDWRPLRARLNECYWQDHPHERPAASPPKRTTPQKRGVAAATPQKAPGHPTGTRGRIHRSVENTPQTCGPSLREEEKKDSEDTESSPSALSAPPPPILGEPEKTAQGPAEKTEEKTADPTPATPFERFKRSPGAEQFERWRKGKGGDRGKGRA